MAGLKAQKRGFKRASLVVFSIGLFIFSLGLSLGSLSTDIFFPLA